MCRVMLLNQVHLESERGREETDSHENSAKQSIMKCISISTSLRHVCVASFRSSNENKTTRGNERLS